MLAILAAEKNMADEIFLLKKIAKFWNQQDWFDRPDGLLIVTNRHLLFVPQGQTVASLCFPLTQIENLHGTRVMGISPAIEFEVAGRTYVFTVFWNARAVLQAMTTAQPIQVPN